MSSWNVLFDWPPNWKQWRTSISDWFKRLSSWILIGLLAQLAAGIWIGGSGISSDVDLARGFNKPIIAFELAIGPEEADPIVQGKNLAAMQTQFHRDFVFIATYSLTFALLGWALFKGRGVSLAKTAGAALIVLGLAAGGMDVLENIHGLAALKHQAGALAEMRFASLIKWTLLGAICIPAGYAFWPARGWTLFRIFSKVASALLLLAALVFAIGEGSRDWEHLWEFSVGCMASSGGLQVLILILWGREFELSVERKHLPG